MTNITMSPGAPSATLTLLKNPITPPVIPPQTAFPPVPSSSSSTYA